MEAGAVEGAEAPGRGRNALMRPSNCRRPAAGDPASSGRDTDRFNHIPKTAPNKSEARATRMGRDMKVFIDEGKDEFQRWGCRQT
jgi:hypothetical protein